MQRVCFDSVKAQSCDDYQHFLIQGSMREEEDGTLALEAGLKKPWLIDARYVMVLDDDNLLVLQNFVEEFKKLIQKENPDVVIFKGDVKGIGVIPSHSWGKFPVQCDIDWFCYAVKQEMWIKYIQEIGGDPAAPNDFLFIKKCFQNTRLVSWFDQIVAATQGLPSKGRAENEM